ncbi:MAG: helix-turn-helix domain-containing protein [Trueperaceae bacterium]
MISRGFRDAVERASKKGLTVYELSRQTGLSLNSLKDYLASETFNPRVSSLYRVAVVLSPILKIEPHDLMKKFFEDDLDAILEAQKKAR